VKSGPVSSAWKGATVWWRAIVGVVLCAVGAVWTGQGSGAIHGSVMTGHSQYTGLGVLLIVVGLGFLVWAWLVRRRTVRHHSS
jgi:protein-S-isoprenylcysteine O-methyltransferase Ste14